MSLLLQFEQQYSSLTAEVTAKIGRLSMLSPAERREAVQTIDRLLLEVADLLDQMELTVRDLPSGGPDRSKYELRVKSYRSDKEHLERELKNAMKRLREGEERNELFAAYDGSPGTADGTFLTEDHKAQLLRNTETLERSGRKLEDSHRICIETEQIGADVLNDLELQRATINRSSKRLREAEEDLGQSSKVLSTMIRRVIQNRGVLLVVAAVMLIVVGIVIYLSFRS